MDENKNVRSLRQKMMNWYYTIPHTAPGKVSCAPCVPVQKVLRTIKNLVRIPVFICYILIGRQNQTSSCVAALGVDSQTLK